MELFWQVLFTSLAVAACQNIDCRYAWYIPPNGRLYYVNSPGFPNRFPPGSTCYWYLYTDPGYNVDLDCNNVVLAMNNRICQDSLNTVGTNWDGNFCSPFKAQSLNHKMVMVLQSSFSSPGGTFSCIANVNPKELCRCGWSFRTRVVGGENTRINEFPMMVSLVDARKRSHVCGATIISQKYILTAAHCLDALPLALTGVLVGGHDLAAGTNVTKIYRVKRYIYHPGWSTATTRNDIGIIEVYGPIQFSNRVGPACLPFTRSNNYANGQSLTVVGWGTTSFGGLLPQVLQKADLDVVPIERCQASFGANRVNGREQICTFKEGKDSCQMDSGGPLLTYNTDVNSWFLAGIVSYGAACAGDEPSVSTRVSGYLEWIRTATGENFCVL